jgi:hypothetical protein
MPLSAWRSISHVHVFAQMFALRPGFDKLFPSSTIMPLLNPSHVTLTLRYTDWWDREVNSPIRPFQPGREPEIRKVVLPSSVKEVTVEFEQIEAKLAQLDAVVGEVFQWEWVRADGRRLRVKGREAKEGAVKMWKWQGPARFKWGVGPRPDQMRSFVHHGNGDSMGYVVKALVWEVEK